MGARRPQERVRAVPQRLARIDPRGKVQELALTIGIPDAQHKS
jgi:hypothetical protein